MPAPGESPRILIVEDEDLIRDTYARRLAHEGYSVSEARNGREGLTRARQTVPQLILLDVMLPDITGFEVLKSLRSDRRFTTVPVVFFTNLSQHMDKHQAARLGATDYLVKSEVSPADVVSKVRELLAHAGGPRPIANFKLYVDPSQGDAAGFASLLGYPRDYKCSKCGSQMVVQLYGDYSDPWSRSFRARIQCMPCRTGAETKPGGEAKEVKQKS